MKRPKFYFDTTIWNFAFADDAPVFKQATRNLFVKVGWGLFEVYYSPTVLLELGAAPEPRKGQAIQLLEKASPLMLERTAEVERLAALYLQQKALPARSVADALHVGYATVHGMDALLSWNFKHLANFGRRRKLLAINSGEGYPKDLQIVTPLEVADREKSS